GCGRTTLSVVESIPEQLDFIFGQIASRHVIISCQTEHFVSLSAARHVLTEGREWGYYRKRRDKIISFFNK
ncbi:hypothetical protein OM198_22155, partial [Escherichia albertii]|nr:hypothetical protein [Escherichia albertii]